MTYLNCGRRAVWGLGVVAVWAVHGWIYGVGVAVLCLVVELNTMSIKRLGGQVVKMGRIFNILDRINK